MLFRSSPLLYVVEISFPTRKITLLGVFAEELYAIDSTLTFNPSTVLVCPKLINSPLTWTTFSKMSSTTKVISLKDILSPLLNICSLEVETVI